MENKPWLKLKVTKEDVVDIWNYFIKVTKEAQQNEFAVLLAIELRFEPLYRDLQNDWNLSHAKLFMFGFMLALKQINVDVSKWEKYEEESVEKA